MSNIKNMGANIKLKIVISRAIGRFPKCEFDTMLVSMLPKASLSQTIAKIKKLVSFGES